MILRISRIWFGFGLIGVLAAAGCDALGFLRVPAKPVVGTPVAAAQLTLSPKAMRLNVPSDEPCPCPFESTASFSIAGVSPETGARWVVDEPSVATVSPAGLVAALATGSTLVRLISEARVATATIEVQDRGGRAAVVVQ